MKLNKKLIENMDVDVTKSNGRVHFNFSMNEVEYNKYMNTKVKSSGKVKQPTTKELLISFIGEQNKFNDSISKNTESNKKLLLKISKDIEEMKNTPTMKKELGLK